MQEENRKRTRKDWIRLNFQEFFATRKCWQYNLVLLRTWCILHRFVKDFTPSSLRLLRGLRTEDEGRASELGESEDLSGEEEKEDAISEDVRSVYTAAWFRPPKLPAAAFHSDCSVEGHCTGTHKRITAFILLPDPFACPSAPHPRALPGSNPDKWISGSVHHIMATNLFRTICCPQEWKVFSLRSKYNSESFKNMF